MSQLERNTGNLYIVAAPSGGGKTSLVRKIVEELDNIEISISHTTRAMRPGEVDGKDYFFINQEQFQSMAANKEFLEFAEVFNCFYGTSLMQIQRRISTGVDVILDIDWQGAEQLRRMFANTISVFIIPPSMEVLKQRLMSRGQDADEIIASRMRKAQNEMSHYKEFDYLIVNEDFEQAFKELKAIVVATRVTLEQQIRKQSKLLSILMTIK